MRTKKVSRYWCDHCNKAGLSRSAMARHEQHCTLNPERSCRVCNLLNGGSHGKPMSELVAMLPDSALYHTSGKGIEDCWRVHKALSDAANAALPSLREAVSECPACILAALRQAKIPLPMVDDFDFTAEMKSIFNDINEERFQCCAH